MALFVDGNPAQLTDLANYESAILDVAATEGIDLSAKLTIATLEIGLALQRFLNTTAGGRSYTLRHIAVTDGLRHWHALLALAATYRDAHFQQLNDRHKTKWKEYEALAKEAGRALLESGVGIVLQPVPKASPPLLTQAGGPHPARTYYARVSWVDAAGVEGSPGETAAITTQEGSTITARAAGAPANARGWNLYLGLMEDQMSRQNNAPLAQGSTWTLPGAGVITGGAAPPSGQSADTFLQHIPMLQRG